MDKNEIGPIHEISIPTSNLEVAKEFYAKFGYETINEQPWGMVQLKNPAVGPLISLFSISFFKTPSLSIQTKDINKFFDELKRNGIKITEDDRGKKPSRFVCSGPDNFEITVYQK